MLPLSFSFLTIYSKIYNTTMNFNNTWRNYVNQHSKSKGRILGERIFREHNLLAEGRKADAKKIAPIADHFGTIDVMAQQLRGLFGDRGMAKVHHVRRKRNGRSIQGELHSNSRRNLRGSFLQFESEEPHLFRLQEYLKRFWAQ